MKLLLHICCAPCLIYPLEQLRKKGFSLTGFFYNPNIHPLAEYKKRQAAVLNSSRAFGIQIISPDYLPRDFFQAVNLKEDSRERCMICWRLRLKKTAQVAAQKKFDYFSTTLLVSPYQDQQLLKKIAEEIAQEEGPLFCYEDFRPGFKKAHQKAKEQGIYCQKYCGCIYSEIERCQPSARH